MIRLGKTYGNLMVDVAAANEKLRRASGGSSRSRAVPRGGRRRRARGVGGDLVSRSCRSSLGSTHEGARSPRRIGPEHRRGAGERAVRLGVEAALVDGKLVPEMSRSSADGSPGSVSHRRTAAGSPCPGSSTSRPTALRASTSSRLTPTGTAMPEKRCSRPALPPSFRRSSPPRRAAPRRPPRGACPRGRASHTGCTPRRALPVSLRLGIHPAASRRNPDLELLDRLLDAGPVRLVTLAPELPGRALIERLLRREIAVSCGHSDAGRPGERSLRPRRAERDAPLQRHASVSSPRPGVAGAALARPDVVVQLIVDWVHVAPVTAAMVWQAAQGRVALVTDAVAGAALEDGTYRLGDLGVGSPTGWRAEPPARLPEARSR